MTNSGVIAAIQKIYPSVTHGQTCDGFKFGNPEDRCSGVVTSCVLTIDVITKAIALGCNLMIVHEPSFYTHDDDTDWLSDNDVYMKKAALLMQGGISVWRSHDCMHSLQPDEIMSGVLETLDWQDCVVGNSTGFPLKVEIAPTTVRDLALHIKQRLRLRTGRMVGNPDARVSRIVFCAHVFPSWGEAERTPTQILSQEDVDVLIPGELIDWTVVSYARDAAQLGLAKAIIQPGHFNWEEPGMAYLCRRIAAVLPELPVHFVPSGDPYYFV